MWLNFRTKMSVEIQKVSFVCFRSRCQTYAKQWESNGQLIWRHSLSSYIKHFSMLNRLMLLWTGHNIGAINKENCMNVGNFFEYLYIFSLLLPWENETLGRNNYQNKNKWSMCESYFWGFRSNFLVLQREVPFKIWISWD